MKKLTPEDRNALLDILQSRFEENMHRHPGVTWRKVLARLEAAPDKLASLNAMERTGGEPDVTGQEREHVVFVDCATESPDGRRSLCYDEEALEMRKKHPPSGSATGMAAAMGAELLTEAQYRRLQELGEFDTRTSSWLQTPPEIRDRGGAIFGDFRYGTVFIYHNGAESYYAARGFRCVLRA